MIDREILAYNKFHSAQFNTICSFLSTEINAALPKSTNKIWHAHPVWFLDGNPVVGYSVLKGNVRLLFWSGQSFNEPSLHPEGSFKAAEARFSDVREVDVAMLKRWLEKSEKIQWDYKNIVKRKGYLERIK